MPETLERMPEFWVARLALVFLRLLEPSRFGLGMDPVVGGSVDEIAQEGVDFTGTGVHARTADNEMAVEAQDVALLALTQAAGDVGIELRPERIKVVATHICAVPAVADVVLAVQRHEARRVAQGRGQTSGQPVHQVTGRRA